MKQLPERQGRIAEWNDERGFGFIDDPEVRARVFVHIRAFGRGAGRPVAGDRVAYVLGEGRDGRAAAPRARILDDRRASVLEHRPAEAPTRVAVRIVAALMLATAVVCCAVTGRGPLWLPVLYLIGGALSFLAYTIDKGAAIRGEWRINEGMLHLIDAVFGVAGGLLAQGLLRHKSSKASFAATTAVFYAMHMAGLLALLGGVLQVWPSL
ncbi:MAG TPA: cold shock and DUF1294 domain-containing protein [Devosia sp.]|jgi:uncharacterized membrane protein YsdA (DUF1294 family)/cold shock CspA family protein|nr:cold shock and DUF1294 domain-containing protein [Devosia sp.]